MSTKDAAAQTRTDKPLRIKHGPILVQVDGEPVPVEKCHTSRCFYASSLWCIYDTVRTNRGTFVTVYEQYGDNLLMRPDDMRIMHGSILVTPVVLVQVEDEI